MSKTMDKYTAALNSLMEIAVYAKYRGVTNPICSATSLDDDGRTRKSLLKQLTSSGFITFANDKSVQISSALYSTISTEVVDIVEKWEQNKNLYYDEFRGKSLAAITLNALHVHERKWLFENSNDFEFSLGRDIYDIMNWNKPLVNFQPGNAESYKEAQASGWNIYVTCDKLKRYVQTLLKEKKVKFALKNSLCAGLDHLGLLFQLDREQAKRVLSVGDGHPFSDSPGFTAEPDKWEEQIEKAEVAICQKATRLMADLQFLQNVRLNVKKFGGWDKFMKEYEDFVRAEMNKE